MNVTCSVAVPAGIGSATVKAAVSVAASRLTAAGWVRPSAVTRTSSNPISTACRVMREEGASRRIAIVSSPWNSFRVKSGARRMS